MGWRDRDYARWTDEERRRFLGPTTSTATARGRAKTSQGGPRVSQGVGAAVAVSAALFALGHFPSGHPIVPALHFNLPSRGSGVRPGSAPIIGPALRPTVTLNGPKVVPVHSFLTFHGPVPAGDEGTVQIRGNLNGGGWHTLAVADGSSGAYVARIALNERGRLRIRVVFRDGARAAETIRVR